MPKTLHVIFEWQWSKWNDVKGEIPLILEVPWAWNILLETQWPPCVKLEIIEREKDTDIIHHHPTPIEIAGIVVGTVLGLVLIGLAIFLLVDRKKEAEREDAEAALAGGGTGMLDDESAPTTEYSTSGGNSEAEPFMTGQEEHVSHPSDGQ
jgi:hypothetical protein